jgi:hypothetical protein
MTKINNESIVIDTPDGIEMFRLLSMRGRLHIEIDTGMKFRVSTLAAMQRQGLTTKRTKIGALADLNAKIAELGGPADRREAK